MVEMARFELAIFPPQTERLTTSLHLDGQRSTVRMLLRRSHTLLWCVVEESNPIIRDFNAAQ